eukprot:m.377588 g.377588  ORF g.377588 m.377588 type:complete len:102 (-) comp28206_c2_seq1:135-440(-)
MPPHIHELAHTRRPPDVCSGTGRKRQWIHTTCWGGEGGRKQRVSADEGEAGSAVTVGGETAETDETEPPVVRARGEPVCGGDGLGGWTVVCGNPPPQSMRT